MIAIPLVWMLELAASAGRGGVLSAPAERCTETPTADFPADPVALELNIPAFRLDLYQHGVRTHSYRVAVGAREHPTPRGQFAVSSIVWNPWWVPPPSEWARDEVPMPPGAANPMGRVKLQFLPMVFIHGTPLEESVGSAASHGCVRMSNADAADVARRIVSLGAVKSVSVPVDSLLEPFEPLLEMPAW